ncbi:Ger(x)C family spore germination protein [Bacillaceae bacterium SIJ1]|uniref:Ger(x)C family spore germination protein n=1 Tax=Litoribacterium kuwaitense TaxID=1398745 RepID=UPI0013EDA126|nr:Ger(x)C family spore germination protein [Litoribacterium kuwaitense]NGP43931.1 Ger(x)C family spore germination protein [Litoribacterium kuwaitense]
MKRKGLFFILCTFLLLQSSCGATPKILDDVQLATVIGLDPAENHDVKMTISFPVFNPDETTTNETFTTQARTLNENLNGAGAQSSKVIETGKLDTIVINEELAKQGITDYLDFLKRGANTGAKLYIVISESPAQSLLKGEYAAQDLGVYLDSMLQQNMNKRMIPEMNLHLYQYALFSTGGDPILPILKQSKDVVEISGIAIMDKDKFVEKIPFEDTFYFNAIYDDVAKGAHRAKDEEGNIAYIRRIDSIRTVNFNKKDHSLTLSVDMEGEVLEYTGSHFTEERSKEVEENLKNRIEEKGLQMLKRFQELNVDPLGFGDDIQGRAGFSWQEWQQTYPNLKMNVTANVIIVNKGISE